ncbi:MAG: TIGR00300 family protein [Sumerlaeia bacterium]
MTTPTRNTILMCPPDYFSVDYVINPWMEGNTDRPDPAKTAQQWANLRDAVANRAEVELLQPQPGVPDLVFTANAGIVYGKKAVLSHFRHPQRQKEEPHNKRWFEQHGFEVIEMPRGVYFEGGGDGLLDRGKPDRLFMGYGFRTILDACEFVSQRLGLEVIPMRLVDERFYHLDTCFCPLEGGHFIYYPAAFDQRSLARFEELIAPEKRFAVSEADAVHFACNAIDTGNGIVLNDCTPELQERLESWGFEVVKSPLTQFIMAGGSAKCLSLRVTEKAVEVDQRSTRAEVGFHASRRILTFEGHLLDSGMMNEILDRINATGGAFQILDFRAGVRRDDKSYLRLAVTAPDEALLNDLLGQLIDKGGELEHADQKSARLEEVEKDGVAPDDFYCSNIYPTDIHVDGKWVRVGKQRMDGMIVIGEERGELTATCTLMRNLKKGDKVVCGYDGVRLHQNIEKEEDNEFKFMSSNVSSERRVEIAVDTIAWEMRQIRGRGGKIVFVAGPVVIHTGGAEYMAELAEMGFINALLSGNAIAVHDIERALYGTSLGVDMLRGVTVHGGHRHHLSAINTVRRCGSIKAAVEQGVLTKGLMYSLVKNDVPFCLAGSIRDDGPLPDTLMDLVEAQTRYQDLLVGAEMIVMLSTMLHSIGVGNMTPAGVKLVCVDINTAVATKLADRGSVESTPVVTDVGLFLNLLIQKIKEMELK